ncbi:MAG: DNA topoisomerase I [Acidaminobacter sp.]|uniref:topoisomerase DNA-binding C4 zinc finger domain-containing protein n=1 Tax=Acidaminobacter sp. TaxID=1872102 RepID=UPI0013862FBE|nr:topoisomerase DNA-binding C4 zinc finger domain-containing protein [Acidaminobacter sp.]MZQ97671.1 DNA topoisomerase I [Acidaminobacter sp.]
MAQRTVALSNGKYIGIETIYTVINGQQINIPEKLKELRAKSQNNELFCPCGCGSNLILVAGDKNLREQHFRLKDCAYNQDCNVISEGKLSVDSKIVLKCWLDDKLKVTDVESRVPIQAVDDINRKYEFSFLSREKKIALSYCHDRVNLSDEKMELLENNSQGIHIIYVVDCMNGGSDGQYPEGLMKVQNKQGYCLLLNVDEADYISAKMEAVFYAKNIDGLWQEESFADGRLSDFFIDDDGKVMYAGNSLEIMKVEAEEQFNHNIEIEKIRRAEEEKQRAENLKRLLEEEVRKREERIKQQEEAEKERIRQAEVAAKSRAELEEKRRLEEEQHQEEKRRREQDFWSNLESNFTQQETQVKDAEGNRYIKCEFCGKIAKDNEFNSYGGVGHVNLGTCKECSANNPDVKLKLEETVVSARSKYDANTCPECGGQLRERSGPYGRFMGCSNYPDCRYNRKIRN